MKTIQFEGKYSTQYPLSNLYISDSLEISIVVEGSGIHKVLNETFECHKGDMYALDKGIMHGFFAKDGETYPTVCTISFHPVLLLDSEHADFNNERFCYGVFRDGVPISYAKLNAKLLDQVCQLYKRMQQELSEKKNAWQDAVKSHLTLLLITVGRYINLADTKRLLHPKEWVVVSAAMRAVMSNYSDCNMTLESIAEPLFISKSHLSRLFQKVYGVSFLDYVRDVRISLACELLLRTNLTNEEIVGRCGLKDIPSFYRLFKNNMGMTPYQYRMSQFSNYQNIKGETNMSVMEISENLQRGKAKIVKELVEKAISEGVPAVQILNEGLLHGMNIIGEKFKNNEIYVPEVLVAARAMNMGVQVLKPLLVEDGVQASGRVCIGAVQGDLHDIGKNLVKMMLEGKGLEVIDLGTDVSAETFVQAAIDNDCKVICCSALLTTTMYVMGEVVKEAQKKGIRDKVKIMVGGAPVTEEFCQRIGADRYTVDAASAADAAFELCQ